MTSPENYLKTTLRTAGSPDPEPPVFRPTNLEPGEELASLEEDKREEDNDLMSLYSWALYLGEPVAPELRRMFPGHRLISRADYQKLRERAR